MSNVHLNRRNILEVLDVVFCRYQVKLADSIVQIIYRFTDFVCLFV